MVVSVYLWVDYKDGFNVDTHNIESCIGKPVAIQTIKVANLMAVGGCTVFFGTTVGLKYRATFGVEVEHVHR